MLRVNRLSGFGGAASPGPIISTGSATFSFNPSFTADLGPPGIKQIFVAFAGYGSNGTAPWDWGTGTVGGESFTYTVSLGEETAGNGLTLTGGATIRALQTSLTGAQTVTIPIVGYGGSGMDVTAMLAIVVRGFSTTAISYDGGSNQPAPSGDNFTISTVGARLVIGATAAGSAPGNLSGPGSPVTALSTSTVALGYDFAPAGTTGNVYSFTGGKYTIAGASFG